MKKLLVLLSVAFLITGCCLSQIPTQYAYVDEDCNAVLPDFVPMVIVGDNCDVPTVEQIPMSGIVISSTTQVEIAATDGSGNKKSVFFDVVIIDTIAPTIEFDTTWVSYTNEDIGNMYKSFYGWVQEMGDEYNEKVAGTTEVFDLGDTILTHTYDTMRYFRNTIPIFEYRVDEGYWYGETPDMTAYFKR